MRWTCVTFAVLALGAAALGAAPVQWSATDVRGANVRVPSSQPAVLVFVLPQQPLSASLLQQLPQLAQVQAVLIVSGKEAAATAKQWADDKKIDWPIVADPDYAVSGQLAVHAWPTTLVIGPEGQQIGHLAGLPKSYGRDLDSYIAHAAGKIDAATLQRRLQDHQSIVDSPQQMADRHLAVAMRLMDKGLAAQAKAELQAGLKHQPEHPGLRLAMADVLLLLREHEEAARIVAQLDDKGAPPWRVKILQARVLMAQDKLDEAKQILQSCVRLNPDPAEAWYQLGIVHQRAQEWSAAAAAYRQAFEHTPAGRRLAASTEPATQPAP
jgi:tetratricopeptide (TPR) repeat protein